MYVPVYPHVGVCSYVFTCRYMCVPVYPNVGMCSCVSTCRYMCVPVYPRVDMCSYVSTCRYVLPCICMWICAPECRVTKARGMGSLELELQRVVKLPSVGTGTRTLGSAIVV